MIGAGFTHYTFLQRDLTLHIKAKFESYLHQAEEEINSLYEDPEFLSTILTYFNDDDQGDPENRSRLLELSEKPYSVFIFVDNRLAFWSNDKAKSPKPENFDLKNPYFSDGNGNYYRILARQSKILGHQVLLVSSIPIRLGSSTHPFGHINLGIPKDVHLSTNPGVPILTSSGEDFLYLSELSKDRLTKQDIRILLLLYGLAAMALAVLVQKITNLIKKRVGPWESIGFLIFTTVGIRTASMLFGFSDQFGVVKSCDASLMSPAFDISLADLLINICIFLWVSVYTINNLRLQIDSKNQRGKQILTSFLGYFMIAAGLIFLGRFCQQLIQNTSIDFNFESVFNLDRISILSLVGIILLLFTQFIWSAKLVSIIQKMEVPIPVKVGSGIAVLAFSIPVLQLVSPSIPWVPFLLVAGIFILLLDIFLEVKTPNFTWIVLWLVVLSGFSSILLFKFNQDKDIEIRTAIAQSLTEEIDTVALSEITRILEVVEEPLSQVGVRAQVIDLIENDFVNGSPYLKTHYHILFPKASALNQSDVIEREGHIFYRKAGLLDHYFLAIEGADGLNVLTAFAKKKNNPYSPLPSFVPAKNFKGIKILNEYEYAIYKDGRCTERSTSNYKMTLEEVIPPVNGIRLVYPNNRSELIYNNGEYVTLVGKKLTGLIKPVSLFSYLFVIIVVIILSLLILNSIFPYLPSEFNFTLSNQISLRNKIQVSVLTLIILSFIIIGLVTVFYFQTTAEKNSDEKLKQTASSLQYEIQENIRDDQTNAFDSVFKTSVWNLAIKYNTHIQLFDVDGILVQTSDQEAVDQGYLSDRISVEALIELKKQKESIHIDEDQRRGLQKRYKIAYLSLVTNGNKALGYVGLPVYPKSIDAGEQVKDFMGTLLNVYVFLLLIAGAFALAVANSITRPMTVLGQKLKEFKLGKSNEPLEWNTKDELGILIKEYNQMIVKLDESADLLAVTEREVAWREMAKQVAHEIKNPLTPMRLSIQHLQHAMQNADPIESRQLVQRVGITLIEQIDNLSRIAAEFSTFAKMPKPQYERIILNDLVASVHDLFKKRDDMDFNLYVPIDEIYVNADRSHLLRVLNNLIKNAIQAIPASRRGIIDIKLETKEDRTIIQVSDNGKGISREMREKVFYPNFTTKTSGTGLGLAISKNIIESFGGRIYFETSEGIGTKFFFELPLLQNSTMEIREAPITNRIS